MNRLTGTERIFLVEDDAPILELANRILTCSGYDVTPASDGREAWELFQDAPDAFDLVFLDVILPHLHGLRLGRRIRALRPDLPILYTSGFTPFGERTHLQDDAHAAFLAKPYGPQALLTQVRRMLGPGRKVAGAEA